ncbi:zinc finger protein 808-like isoform X6 [Macrobrachium nipponense]|uniref:zinc finger protein 808-like isoform X6 n=1 Tax=Macrobrachium nipponense TaxID=159736 RepID=UPI0030C7B5CA
MSSDDKIMEGGGEGSSHDTHQAITCTIHIMAPTDLGTNAIDSALVASVEAQDTRQESDSSLLVVPADGDDAINVSAKNIIQTVTETNIGSVDLPVISNINSDQVSEQSIELITKDEKHVEDIEEDIGCHCLICNEELQEQDNISVFKSFTTTSQRKVSIFLGDLVGQKLTSRKTHSTIICDKCFKLLNKLDLLEFEIQETKEEIITKYQETIAAYGGRARRKKPAAAKKSDYVFPKIEPEEEDKEGIEIEGDEIYQPQVDDLLEEEQDRREDRDSLDEEWEPEVKRARIKKESTADPSGPPKRKRGRPRKDASKTKEETALYKIDGLEGRGDGRGFLTSETNEFEKSESSKSGFHVTRVKRRLRIKHSKAQVYLDEPLSCADCGELFNNEPLYRIHCTEAHGPLNGMRCPHCPLVFDKRHDLDSHMINHNPINHVCKICNVGFPLTALLIKHLKKAHPDNANTCVRCNAVFVDEVQLHNHFVQKHKRGMRRAKVPLQEVPKNSVVCRECSKVCPNIVSYQSHKYREHLHLFPFECQVCWRRFSKDTFLENHLKTHIEGTFKCLKCGVKFANESHLVDHMYFVHGQKKVLMCGVCKKSFSSPNSLKTHKEMVHRDLMDCNEVCEVCNEKYPSKASLKRHMLVHNREYQCTYCGGKRASKASLELHINMIHSKEQTFICPFCSKEFFAKHLMQMHVKRVHSDRSDFQYKCDLCGKVYLQEWELTLHHKTHTNERNYKCDVCGDAFYTLSRMRYHRATHKTTRDSECPVCAQMFRRDVDTKNHLRRVHKVVNPGNFMELCARYGKEKAKELHDGSITEKTTKLKAGTSSEHITLYSVKEELEPPLQVIIPDGVEMMVFQGPNCDVTDVPGLVDDNIACVYEVNQADINQVEMSQVDINQVEINQVDLSQIEMSQVDISQVQMNEVKMSHSGEILSIIKIEDFGS